MIDSLIESLKNKTEELNEKADKVEKYEDVASVIKEYEDIIRTKKKSNTCIAYQQGKAFNIFKEKEKFFFYGYKVQGQQKYHEIQDKHSNVNIQISETKVVIIKKLLQRYERYKKTKTRLNLNK